MEIGEKIKAARKACGLTQKQLAKKLGVAEITVRQYDSNKRQPRLEQIKRIAVTLKTDVAYLSGWQDAVSSRKTLNVTLEDLAFEFDIPVETLEQFESGVLDAPWDFAIKYDELARLIHMHKSNTHEQKHSEPITDEDIKTISNNTPSAGIKIKAGAISKEDKKKMLEIAENNPTEFRIFVVDLIKKHPDILVSFFERLEHENPQKYRSELERLMRIADYYDEKPTEE